MPFPPPILPCHLRITLSQMTPKNVELFNTDGAKEPKDAVDDEHPAMLLPLLPLMVVVFLPLLFLLLPAPLPCADMTAIRFIRSTRPLSASRLHSDSHFAALGASHPAAVVVVACFGWSWGSNNNRINWNIYK